MAGSFTGFSKIATNTFWHLSKSLSNKNYTEARRRIKEAHKTHPEDLSLANLDSHPCRQSCSS